MRGTGLLRQAGDGTRKGIGITGIGDGQFGEKNRWHVLSAFPEKNIRRFLPEKEAALQHAGGGILHNYSWLRSCVRCGKTLRRPLCQGRLKEPIRLAIEINMRRMESHGP